MATAHEKIRLLALRLERYFGRFFDLDDVATLRRAEMTLHRWAEGECGDSNDHASWSIERDDETGIPYRCVYPHNSPARRCRIPDRETGALRRVAAVCERLGIHYFHQSDPRGCSLYLSREPITDRDYTRGVPVCE